MKRASAPIAFQGERGAFSEEAARKLLGPRVEVLPCPRFEDLFLCLKDGRASSRSTFPSGQTRWVAPAELRPSSRSALAADGATGSTWSKSITAGSVSWAIPTRGTPISWARCGDVSLGWLSPIRGPVNPRRRLCGEPMIGFLSGFDEFLMRRGLESNWTPSSCPTVAPLSAAWPGGQHPAHKVEAVNRRRIGRDRAWWASSTRPGCSATNFA